MARLAAASDAFNAVGDPGRRRLLDCLGASERAVGELVAMTQMAQPQVSRHLGVLRQAGVVSARKDGQRRLYRINGPALRLVHDWLAGYAQLWDDRYDQLDVVLDELRRDEDRT